MDACLDPTQGLQCSEVRAGPGPGEECTGIKHEKCSERPKYYSRESEREREKLHFHDNFFFSGVKFFLVYKLERKAQTSINTFV